MESGGTHQGFGIRDDFLKIARLRWWSLPFLAGRTRLGRWQSGGVESFLRGAHRLGSVELWMIEDDACEHRRQVRLNRVVPAAGFGAVEK